MKKTYHGYNSILKVCFLCEPSVGRRRFSKVSATTESVRTLNIVKTTQSRLQTNCSSIALFYFFKSFVWLLLLSWVVGFRQSDGCG